jgi:hypothetical protein
MRTNYIFTVHTEYHKLKILEQTEIPLKMQGVYTKSTFSFTKKYDILLFTLINSLCD